MRRTSNRRPVKRLLVSRAEVAEMLGIHEAGVLRLEKKGKLLPLKHGGPQSKAYYRVSEVEALVEKMVEAAETVDDEEVAT